MWSCNGFSYFQISTNTIQYREYRNQFWSNLLHLFWCKLFASNTMIIVWSKACNGVSIFRPSLKNKDENNLKSAETTANRLWKTSHDLIFSQPYAFGTPNLRKASLYSIVCAKIMCFFTPDHDSEPVTSANIRNCNTYLFSIENYENCEITSNLKK